MNSSLMNINELKQWKIEKIQKIKSILVNLSINEKMYIYINVVKKKSQSILNV